MRVWIVWQEDVEGGEIIVGVFADVDWARRCCDAGNIVGLSRRTDWMRVEEKYNPDSDTAVLIKMEEV